MKALVLYDSVFGNTEKVARTIHEELQNVGQSNLKNADTFRVSDLNQMDLLVVGSPTRAFTMTPKMKTLLKGLPKEKLTGIRYLAFDSRANLEQVNNKFLTFMVGRFGYAAEKISKILEKKGSKKAGDFEVFYVKESEGPLMDGELEKAKRWIKRSVS